jgi:hypothetical protein
MRFTAHYNLRYTVEFGAETTDPIELKKLAEWFCKNKSGRADIELVQVLPEGVPSELLRDNPQPPEPTRPLPPPPMPPLGGAGDQMLQRAAA